MDKVFAFIDGFNVYHLLENHYQSTGENLKWLSYPSLINQLARAAVPSENISFFTARPTHVSDKKQDRHRLFCKAQTMLGIQIYEGHFKKSLITCKAKPCGKFLEYTVNQEKQTDVNIALTLIEAAYREQEGRFYLITADTDQVPTARLMQRLFPKIRFYWVYPNSTTVPGEIRQTLNHRQILNLRWGHYRKNQMPESFTVNGETVHSPYGPKGNQ